MLRIRSERRTGLNFFSGLPKYTGHCVEQVPHLAHISIYSLRTLGPPSIAVIAPITSSAKLSVILSPLYQGLGKEKAAKVKDLRKRNEHDEHLGQRKVEQKHFIFRDDRRESEQRCCPSP